MLTEELRSKLVGIMKKDPKEAIKEIEMNPQLLKILLAGSSEVERERKEKLKYVNMNIQMQNQLEKKSKELKTTQGILIGAGILLLLSLLD